jgi:DNA-binding transcriptional LysR family regulator
MALRAIAENGTFTGAAKALGWNQPSVSKHLQALERTLGTHLLRRNRAGSLLTPEGAVVLEHAIRITEAYQDLLASLPASPPAGDGQGSPVRIAASPTLGQHWLPRVLADLRTAVPDASVTVRVARGREALRHVARGQADLALVEHAPAEDDLVAERIGSDRLMAACHTSHPWADREDLTLDEFLEAPKVLREPGSDLREALDRHLRSAGLPSSSPDREAGSDATLMEQLRRGEHLTVTSSLALDGDDQSGLTGLPIRDADLSRPLWAANPASSEPEPEVARLLDHLRGQAISTQHSD